MQPELRRRRAESSSGAPSALANLPFTVLDGVVAHELWHEMEAAFMARRYRDSIELRRQLGAYFDVDTLEHAVLGGRPGSPPAWRQAHHRLTTEVSQYAGTTIAEATAEMFKLWWCRAGTPTGVVGRFGELVDQFLPA